MPAPRRFLLVLTAALLIGSGRPVQAQYAQDALAFDLEHAFDLEYATDP